ncbi:acyl-CoA-binding domain-containing protein 5 isoform X4 [Hemicordylus capensis]|uniref:acyl-CoA-binding domain-containing protein 5 isoform X4 n=1 Tax=Hemicordylus capensis TaxID=884348 RepID=UPI0023037A69|nr:acyl-CoA-binding domain-containing protein 5 isoform X4 [Hemicordylus capensis]
MAETESGDGGSVHETRFEAAVKVIQSLPKNGSFQPTNEMMLKFYSFYKQATQGPCNIPRPGFWDPIGRYKWDAWSALGDMPKEDAMIAYVEEMKKILETMPMTDKVEELLHVIGPFYEIVEDKKNRGSGIIPDPRNAITSVPAVNGKSESSDSGAESEEEEPQEEITELKQIGKEGKTVEEESAAAKGLDSVVANGYDDVPNADIHNDMQTKSALNGINVNEDLKKRGKHLELPIVPNFGLSQQGHRMHPVGDGAQGGQMGSGGDGERWGSDRGPRSSLNEQIAVVLIRLQEDMQNVFQRLHTLEALTASQARAATLHSNNQPISPVKRPSWWPFEISPGTLAFAVLWPFVAQWLVHVYLQRRRRKQN